MSNRTGHAQQKLPFFTLYHFKIRATALLTLVLFAAMVFSVHVIAATNIKLSNAAGGSGGDPFTDFAAPGGRIAAISIRSGLFVDSIKISYSYKTTVSGKFHGGNGGKLKTFRFGKGEFITELGGQSGSLIDAIYIKTNKGREMRWGGKGGKPFKFRATETTPITGLWGRSSKFVNAIGIIQKQAIKASTFVTSTHIASTPVASTTIKSNSSTSLPSSNKRAIKRTVLTGGTLQILYPDGRVEKRRPNGQVCSYYPNKGEQCVTAVKMEVEKITLPELPSGLNDWVNEINESSEKILRKILTDQQYNTYHQSEAGKSFYDRTKRRLENIDFLTPDGM